MTRIATLIGALLAATALVSSAAVPSALANVPGFLLLSGESGQLTLSSAANTFKTELQNAAGTLTGEGVKLDIALVSGSTDEGTYTADFSKVKGKTGAECSTTGDAAGTVLVSNNKLRTVHDISSTAGNGMLFEVSPVVEILCGAEKITVKGTDLGLFEGTGEKLGGDFTHWAVSVQCKETSGATPLVEKFWGLAGTEEKAKLEANFGSGAKKSCELVGTPTSQIALTSNKMAELVNGEEGEGKESEGAKVPGFLLLSGESGQLTFSSAANTFKTELQNAAGTLTGEGVKLDIALVSGSTDEGTYTADFSKVKSKTGAECSTTGDAAGTVLVSNNKLRTVHDISSTAGNGMLFEVSPEVEIACGTEKITVKGTDLGLFEGTGEKLGGDFFRWAVSVQCKATSGATPLVEKFWGLAGTEEKAKLEANFGSGAKKSCELVGAATSKMVLRTNKMAELVNGEEGEGKEGEGAKVPGFLLLATESGQLTFSSATNTFKTELQSAAGTLTGEGVKLSINQYLGSDDEGMYTAAFSKVKNKTGTECSTTGDAAGTVLVSNDEVRTVHDISSTTGNGMLFEVTPAVEIICGTEKIKVNGTDLGLFESSGTAEGGDFSRWAVSVQCKEAVGGTPLEERFWGLAGAEEKAKLEVNFGAGAKKACELVGTTGAKIELTTNKMAELMESE